MIINKSMENETLILDLDGRLDTSTAPNLQDILIPAFDEAKKIIMDFTKISYISSAGLRVLLMGQKTAKAKNSSMTIRGVSQEIMEIFEMTGFCDMLTII